MKNILVSAILLMFLSSCGLIFGGKSQNINIMAADGSSDVEVEISSGGGEVKTVKLPANVNLKRSNSLITIRVKENACYKKSQSTSDSKMNLFVLLDALGGGLSTTSTTTEYVAGSLWAYDENIMVNVDKKDSCK